MSDRIEELLVGAAVVVAIVMSVIMITLMAAVFLIA
tara:strand:+ start:154 stop:261 length:108 start_codon:yes stop_codon:yes gene_type:complete